MIVDGIKKYFKGCPLLKNNKIAVDYLKPEAVHYSIEPVASNPVIRRYIDGSAQKQYIFNFVSREYLDEEDRTNLENNAFYEQLSDWIEAQNRNREFPVIGEKKHVQRVEAMTHGYNYTQDGKTARYQMQCRIIYLEI